MLSAVKVTQKSIIDYGSIGSVLGKTTEGDRSSSFTFARAVICPDQGGNYFIVTTAMAPTLVAGVGCSSSQRSTF